MAHNIIIKNLKWILLALMFWAAVFKCSPKEFYDLDGDSAQYIILADSLAKGTGLKMVNYPQEPVSFYFPPLLSFLLSPVIYFFGKNFYLMHIVIALLGFLSLYFFYQILKRYSDTLTASLCIFLFATNWAFIIYSAQYILSEVPYLFFSGFTLFMVTRYTQEPSFLNKTALFLIFGLLLCYFTRHSGFVLFLSVIAFLLAGKQRDKFRRASLVAGGFLLVFAGWNILEAVNSARLTSHTGLFFLIDPYAPDKGTIFAHPIQLLIRFTEGINRVFALLAPATFFYFLKKSLILNDFLSAFIMILVFIGFWIKFKQDRHSILHYYFLFYLFLLFLWIFYDFIEGVRYLLPVLPFILFYFLIGFQRVLSFITKDLKKVFLPLSFGIFLVFNLMNFAVIPKSSQININSFPAPFRNFILMHDWINKNLPDKEIILSRKPTITFLYTNNKSVVFPYTSDSEKIWRQITQDKVKYIIVDEFSKETHDYLSPFLYKYKDRIRLLFFIEKTALLEIKGGAA